MYDFEELRPATDALWSAIAARLNDQGVEAPATLLRGPPLHDIWTDPDLLLAQTCGYPLVTSLAGRVTLVATPSYAAEGCGGTSYRSAIIVRTTDRATVLADVHGRRCAMNGPDSNSGMNVLRAAIAPLAGGAAQFFGAVITTGSHAASADAVAAGDADVAAIDCITWAHLQHLRPSAVQTLRVLAWTQATPGLPLITARATTATTIRALRHALAGVAADAALAPVRAALRLTGFTSLPPSAYEAILALEQSAQTAGYPRLR
jgi:ABC-type phosphate/phosphonate transport system substrate-binding protein